MLTTGSHMNRMTSCRPESAYVFTESFVDPSRAALHKDNTHTHTKHKKKQKNTRALNHTTMPPLFYTQEILHRFHWTHFSLNFLPQTFIRRTCLILWLPSVPLGWCFNPLWSFMFFHWVENDQNDLVVFSRCTPCTIWRCTPDVARCARDHCMELQAAVKMNAGSRLMLYLITFSTWKVISTRYVDPTTWPIQQTILQKAVTPQLTPLTPTDWLPLPAFLMQAWNTMADSPVFFKSVWSNKDNFFQSQVWPIPNQTLR